MSGPKRSSWSIAREQYDNMRRERAARRNSQINEIQDGLKNCYNFLCQLADEHGGYANYVVERVNIWMQEVQDSCNYDLRDAWRGLNGVQSYLNIQADKLAEKRHQFEERRSQAASRELAREQKKAQTVKDAEEQLDTVRKELDEIDLELGEAGASLLKNPNQWLCEAEASLAAEPEKVLKSVRGIKKYLQDKQAAFDALRQERLGAEKTARLTASIETIRDDFHDILNPGIEQRIELFTKAVKTNPDNPQTLKQIASFKTQLAAEMVKFEEQQENLKYIENVFSDALGSSPKSGEDGSSTIAGAIEGVPITVSIDKKSNDIHFDTPTDGSCKAGIKTLVTRLEKSHINLGPIRIIKSGETINNKASNYQQKNRHHA